jgi:transcriptional regulator with XRE-family HTH domain
MAKIKKQGHELPREVVEQFIKCTELERNAYIKALREIGWTLESVGSATGLTRERIRQITVAVPLAEALKVATAGYPLPHPPVYEEKSTREFIEPSEETLKRLLELQPYAQQVRSYGKAFRQEAEEYTWLLNYAHVTEGVTLYRLAKRLGVTHGAIRFRLVRYGYKTASHGLSKAYTAILPENRLPINEISSDKS